MTKGQTQVADFMRFFGQDLPEKPSVPSEETARLRARLILEEALETIVKGLGLAVEITTASGVVSVGKENLADIIAEKGMIFKKQSEPDLKELADGLGDLNYVAGWGTANAVGIDMEPIDDEIHRSNMTKAWREEDLAKAKELYPTAKVENYGGGLYRLVREDGKIIKSPSYRPANIQAIIDSQSSGSASSTLVKECPNCTRHSYVVEDNRCAECGCTEL